MRTFKDVLRQSDEIQNLKNVAYCTIAVVVLVLGTFLGVFTTSFFDGKTPSRIFNIEQRPTVELSQTP